jgi:hypothetical protein
VKPAPGQRITFSEAAAGVAHVIGAAHGRRGTLRFVPGAGPMGARRIVAQVTQRGLPRAQRVVARYRAPGPLRLARPRGIHFRRTADTLRVSWRAVKGARGYELLASTINRRRELFRVDAKHRQVTLAGLPRGDRAAVQITPLDALHRPGRSARAVAKPARSR